MDNLTHSGAFAMFAASAPDVPDWFEHISLVVPPPDGSILIRSVNLRRESPMEHLVRWRIAYATAMVAGLTAYIAKPQQPQQEPAPSDSRCPTAMQEYQPELVTIKKDDLLAAIELLRTSLEYVEESKLQLASNQHILGTRILTTLYEATNNDIDDMESAIANLNNYLLNRNK